MRLGEQHFLVFFQKNGEGSRRRATNSWFVGIRSSFEVHNVTHDWMTAYVLRHGRLGAW